MPPKGLSSRVVSAVHAIVFVNPSVSERGYLAVQAGIFGVIDRVGRRGQTPFVEICSSSFNSRRTPGPGVWALRKVFKSMNVSADPGSQLLVSGGLLRHKCRNSCPTPSRTTTLARFAGNRIVHRNRCTGPVHKTLLARLIYLAKNYILLPAPTLVEPAEATVAVPFRMHLPVFFPSQLQRQMAMLLQLRVQSGKIREDLFGESFFVPAALRTRPARRAARPSLPESTRGRLLRERLHRSPDHLETSRESICLRSAT